MFPEIYQFFLFYLSGIHPVGGKTDQSIICDCGPATGKLRKELEAYVAWEDNMWKPKSDSFNEVKQKIEAQVFLIFPPATI